MEELVLRWGWNVWTLRIKCPHLVSSKFVFLCVMIIFVPKQQMCHRFVGHYYLLFQYFYLNTEAPYPYCWYGCVNKLTLNEYSGEWLHSMLFRVKREWEKHFLRFFVLIEKFQGFLHLLMPILIINAPNW